MRKFIGLMLLPLCSLAVAQGAPVEELGSGVQPGYSSGAAPRPAGAAAQPQNNQALTNLHFELQSLREEVRELRGIVEEQSNELQQLKQRQLDDYQDLDSRISAGGAAAAPTRPNSSMAQTQMPSQQTSPSGMDTLSEPTDMGGTVDTGAAMGDGAFSPVPTGGPTGGDEGDYEAYVSTYNLLKAKKIDEAVAGFKVFVAKFPNSQYTANSYYWLGEIYLLQNNLPEAASAFANVAQKFPAHRKAEDSKFKLAKVYHLQGKNDQAKKLLSEVASSNSSAASLARAYLNDNFQ